MSAQTLMMLLNVFYLVMMGLVAVIGTGAMIELIIALLREKSTRPPWQAIEPEDA